jgi:hypothetical protein
MLQPGTPEHLAELAPRLRLKPFGLYLRAEVDPAFAKPGSVVGLDPGTDLADWEAVDWRDKHGAPVHTTTEPGELGTSVLTTLSAKAQRWMKVRAERIPLAVSVVAIRRAGRAGPAIDARLLDQDEDPDSLRVFYTDESAASLRRFALDIGPRQFGRLAGLSPWAARRLARSGKPTAPMVRRALGGLVTTNFVLPYCACGQPLRRPNAQACSAACRQRAYRERREGRA